MIFATSKKYRIGTVLSDLKDAKTGTPLDPIRIVGVDRTPHLFLYRCVFV